MDWRVLINESRVRGASWIYEISLWMEGFYFLNGPKIEYTTH